MTVEELITHLLEFPQDMEVYISAGAYMGEEYESLSRAPHIENVNLSGRPKNAVVIPSDHYLHSLI